MEKVFNKLVRDNIPDIIKNNGEEAITRILNDCEYRKELFKKLEEEVSEAIKSEDSDELLLELADILEVLESIAELHDKSLDDVIELAKKKRQKRGGFKKRIFLEKTV